MTFAADPRRAAIERYAQAYDHFAEMSQLEHRAGRPVAGEGAHQYAYFALRAYEAEDRRGPEPAERLCSQCKGQGECRAYEAIRQ